MTEFRNHFEVRVIWSEKPLFISSQWAELPFRFFPGPKVCCLKSDHFLFLFLSSALEYPSPY